MKNQAKRLGRYGVSLAKKNWGQAFYFDVANPLLDGSEETARVSGLDVRRMGIDLRVQAL